MTKLDSSSAMKPSTDKCDITQGREETSIGHWVLQEKSNMPNRSVQDMVADHGYVINSPNFEVPGGERWGGVGVDLGDLALPNAREILNPNEFGSAFQNLPLGPTMDKVWADVTDLSINEMELLTISKKENANKLVGWAPWSMMRDPVTRTYFTYHPLVLETKHEKRDGKNVWLLVGYNKSCDEIDNKNWVSLPSIDFLPRDEALNDRRIIAGSAGLLVVDGGLQGREQKMTLWGRLQTPNKNFWRHPEIYKGYQSIVFITNPLTKEYIILPPLPGRLLNKKVGKFIWRNMERTSYILILIGWDSERDKTVAKRLTKHKAMTNSMASSTRIRRFGEKIGVFVYCSEDRCYVYCDEIEGRPTPYRRMGSSGIGIIGYGVFVGGTKATSKHKTSNLRSDESKNHPCVYYFNVSASSNIKKSVIPFVVNGIPESVDVQAPKVVQGGLSRVFATTRATSAATTLYVVEIVLNDLRQFQHFQLKASMPKGYFRRMFFKSPSDDVYEASSCNGVLSFKGSGKQNVVVFYDVHEETWYDTIFPRQKNKVAGHYNMADAAYEPNFLARP